MTKLRTMPVTVWAVPLLFVVLALLAGCGGDGDNNDTIWTGLSGVVILIVVVALLWRWGSNRGD